MACGLAGGLRRWAVVMAGLCLIGVLSLTALTIKERDNHFCVACHLHDEKFARFTAAAPTDLAGFHFRKKAEVGCIACHGGADPVMRTKIWALAAWDTVRYLADTYEEPTRMEIPLRDAECLQCHTPILPPPLIPAAGPVPAVSSKTGDHDEGDTGFGDRSLEASYAADPQVEGYGGTAYHGLRDHDTVAVRCVSCHTTHTTDSDAKSRFISGTTVLPICRECHKQL